MQGLNADIIKNLSKRLRKSWNDYFWQYGFCQSQIRWTREEKTNHVNDLLNYFDDTTELLSNFSTKDSYLEMLPEAISALQMMYIQQDLIDELLLVFKLSAKSNEHKSVVRDLRNELVGHPISRDREGLVSSVFITGQTKGVTLQYARYHRDNNYQSELVTYNWQDIFGLHQKYLEESFNLILTCAGKTLRKFRKKIIELQHNIQYAEFTKLVGLVGQIYSAYPKQSPLFEETSILNCYMLKNEHPRYEHAVGLYLEGLKDNLTETLGSIGEFLNEPKSSKDKNQKNTTVCADSSVQGEHSTIKISNYEFSKLRERNHPSGIDHSIRKFTYDKQILAELLNMKNNSPNSFEHLSSYEYLRTLFKDKKLIE